MFLPQAWCRKNMELMIETIGDLVWMDPITEVGYSMESEKLLVLTSVMPFIGDHFLFLVGETRFEIYIKEMVKSSDCFHKHIEPDFNNYGQSCSRVPETAMDGTWRRSNEEDDDMTILR